MSFARSTVCVAALLALLAPSAIAAPDTLVVAPGEFRAALAPWESYRRSQGHELRVIEPPRSAGQLQAAIRHAASSGGLKYVVLVGDVPAVPTCYAKATVNVRWGSEPTIASDGAYADIDRDGLPDVAIGRIPADTPQELAAVVRKIMRYEQESRDGPWRRQVNVVAGVGGFGPVTDALVEAAGRSVFEQVVPAGFQTMRLAANPAETCKQLSADSLVWIYLGHGLPTELDCAATPEGPRPILCVRDVPRLRCGTNSPLAVLVACYSGAIDARDDCLAEEMSLAAQGPVAVIAATRVTMPYGNSILGCELLRAALVERRATAGDVMLSAQRSALAAPSAADPLRTSLDALARGVSPPPVDLAAERREHVLMYQLLGDPLTRLNYPRTDLRLAAPPPPASSNTVR